ENRSARNQSLRPKSNRKTGGQPGHEGSTLKMSSTPNQIKEMIPGYCNACGNDLREKEAIQVWQQNNHPIELSSNEMMDQRLNYIHQNPVRAGLVYEPEYYVYSSALDYSGSKGLLDLAFIE
ncbi:MAG: hypothetical protein RIC35_20025, partial [Marinoscillum sp.]